MTRRARVRTAGGRSRRRGERGQGLVEFAMVVPVFMLLLLGMLEFGTAFNHQLTIGYATREGARIGADLVNGGSPLGCNTGQSPNAALVDPVIIEAVDRVLTSAGSPIDISRVAQIRIFKADVNGNDTIGGNNWVYTSAPQTLPDGTQVNFKLSGSNGFAACDRSNVVGNTYANRVDSIGVSIIYNYQMVTGLGSGLTMTDKTVMQFNPTNIGN